MSVQAQEQQRHQWLEAIGVTSWLPRQPLPGAAPPAEWVTEFCYPQADTGSASANQGSGRDDMGDDHTAYAEAAPAARRPAAPRSVGPRIDTRALLDDSPKPAASRPAAAEPTSPVAPVAQKPIEPAPHFKLAYLVRGDLLVIDSLPPHHREGFSRQHKRLLQGMTTALGLRPEQELSDPAMLPWPMLASKTLDQGPVEARLAVEHKLKRTLEFRPDIQRILLLGDASVHWVTGEPFTQGSMPQLSGRACVASLSLSELLRLPERKAEVWQDIQPLRQDVDGKSDES